MDFFLVIYKSSTSLMMLDSQIEVAIFLSRYIIEFWMKDSMLGG